MSWWKLDFLYRHPCPYTNYEYLPTINGTQHNKLSHRMDLQALLPERCPLIFSHSKVNLSPLGPSLLSHRVMSIYIINNYQHISFLNLSTSLQARSNYNLTDKNFLFWYHGNQNQNWGKLSTKDYIMIDYSCKKI